MNDDTVPEGVPPKRSAFNITFSLTWTYTTYLLQHTVYDYDQACRIRLETIARL